MDTPCSGGSSEGDLQYRKSSAQGGMRDSLERLVKRLNESERAHATLRAKGYGKSWMSLDEIAKLVPEAGAR